MAGHDHVLAVDPALVKYSNMSTNRHKYFRWTGRTAAISFVFGAVIPSIVGYMAIKTEGKWDMRGKRRGDTIAEF
ncbi:hypothetical protein BCIN_10g02260 [Botrytis cinerea B05.10]|uniref:Uncharacterized protein n=4 Tax=Sclerotiniaceae TaxID=28983 RepID=A0A384JUK8_BOTFB|nr:hypothetical protein BCIN_10g02260 [Botrytis cinerea B05.10]ATZ54210.1 hypothetical protein BCIN_10g02260 [Botrytis cinerea B05.10]EMR89785.1 putative nadh:ubiquinone oxidoreductase subunit protein [Botrytis cinerea BcDW1]TEY72958.1 hypothetical protein BOTCAL_0085g00060 [Botryotinia calthae]CCD54191.1 similar to NADH:ubiquinone oxidoreductase 6.6 [Botrytis cinerea T4]